MRLIIRALREGEFELFDRFPDPGLVGFSAFGEPFQAKLAQGGYRPEWSWVALRDGVVVARAAWWAGPEDTDPLALDWLDFSDADAAVELLRTAPLRTPYELRVPPGWREDPAVRAAVAARIDVVIAAGLTPLVERYRYRWGPDRGLPARSDRLTFRADDDDAVFGDALRHVHRDTLDARQLRTVEREGLDASVDAELDLLRWLPSPRSWWRLAIDRSGTQVGFVIPGYHHSDHVIAFVGVLPEHRGRGYAFDLLAEGTHLLVAEGAERIVAGTDIDNTPMAETFERAGYAIEQHRLDFM